MDFIKTFLSEVSFFEPRISLAAGTKHVAVPKVMSFDAAQPEQHGGLLILSWTTKDADYVRLSYACSERVLIFGEQGSAWCGDTLGDQPNVSANLSPRSSLRVRLTAFHKYDLSAVSVTVTLTPSSHGRGFPASAKPVMAAAHTYNPLPNGLVSPPQNIEISLSQANRPGAAGYSQGSSVKIKWKEHSMTSDSCVNLWLVRDGANSVKHFVLNVAHRCMSPAQGGEYTWKVSSEISGSGFRIYAEAPGKRSAALSEPFSIVP